MNFERELETHFRSRCTLLCIPTLEEERLLHAMREVCTRANRSLFAWDVADFFQSITGTETLPPARDPISALEAIEKHEGEAMFLLRDFHHCWDKQPRVVRKVRNLVQTLRYTKKSIVLTMPVATIPEELKDDVVLMDFTCPGMEELGTILDSFQNNPRVKIQLDSPTRELVLRSALGLTASQAQRVFARAIVEDGRLDEKDIELINHEKRQIIRGFGPLEFTFATEGAADVGGLEVLKEWLRTRERAFSPEARTYGLPHPKGIALIGIPGTGKSLSAKMISAMWRLPLIRLDVGGLFGSLVGESEANARRALRLAETVSPCLLWIDEIEKALSFGGGDGGTSMRVFASILSWMQEKTRPVFVVATANNISILPPELLRRGRFDEVFFLDLPTAVERRQIFGVHLKKRKRDESKFDLESMVQASAGYVGAEIEQSIIDAMYFAFSDPANPQREFTTADVLAALRRLVPMSKSQREVIAAQRQWLTEGRAQSASFKEVQQAQSHFVQLDLLAGTAPR